jgi:UDP-N-acetylglucosamine acyltransferase
LAIHPTAIVHRNAEVDPTVEIGPYCVIDEHVQIEAGCRLYHNVYVTGWTRIGENCVIHPGAIIGHEPQDVKYKGERSYCRIGRNVIVREYVTIHRGTDPESETVLGDDCFLLACCHVAHNCRVGRGVTLINNVLLGGHVELADRVTMGGASVVHQFVRIGELVMVAGNARVLMDVVPFALVDIAGRVAGINRVGLRRAGLSGGALGEIRDAYRLLFDRRLGFAEASRQLEARMSGDFAARIVGFVTSESRRGFAGPSRGTPSRA